MLLKFWRWLQLKIRGYYFDGDFIVHYRYGRYPKQVEFVQGMSIMPQQSAIFKIPVTFTTTQKVDP